MPTYTSILNATPQAINANAYLTAANATNYLTNYRLYESVWQTASLQVQETALIWASALIDRSFDFDGLPTNYSQSMRWPRVGITDDDGRYVDQNFVPTIVLQSTAILAAELVKRDRSAELPILSQGLKDVSVGPIRVTLDQEAIIDIIPNFVILWLGQYGSIRSTAVNGAKVMRVKRT